MILLIDNYDSFTYNLVQRIGELRQSQGNFDLRVWRNDKITPREAQAMKPDHVIISPGPCTPNEAGISVEVVEKLGSRVPIFGVCLGHQCIGQAFGANVIRARRIMHGKTSMINHDGKGTFDNIPDPFEATRYHSLVLENDSVSDIQVA